ncbi:P27 family phage terminase small subunit [Aeromonas media]|uniref:P27 family phage terminase small subunit n=1 Tax=Aeromonas media TaxID=651 RepID=UPI0038CF3428
MSTKKVNGLLFDLPPAIKKLYQRILKLIESERTVRAQEHTLIGSLAQQVFLNQKALGDLLLNGPTLTSVTKHGEVIKENPYLKIHQQSQIQIIKLCTELGLSKKAFTAFNETGAEEEADPIGDFLKNRG